MIIVSIRQMNLWLGQHWLSGRARSAPSSIKMLINVRHVTHQCQKLNQWRLLRNNRRKSQKKYNKSRKILKRTAKTSPNRCSVSTFVRLVMVLHPSSLSHASKKQSESGYWLTILPISVDSVSEIKKASSICQTCHCTTRSTRLTKNPW